MATPWENDQVVKGPWDNDKPVSGGDVESTPEKTIKMKTRGGGTTDVKQSALESGPSASESPFLERTSAAMKGFREGKPQDFLGNLGAAGVELFSPEAQTLGYMGTGGAVYGAGKALLSGAARPALGIAAGFGTGVAVDKAAQALGAPPWLAAEIATLAGAAVGGKVGSPEIAERFKSGGLKGVVSQWINGPVKEDEAFKFYEEQHGTPPKTGKEKLTARAEAVEYKKQVAAKLNPKPPKPSAIERKPPSSRPDLAAQVFEEKYGRPPKSEEDYVRAKILAGKRAQELRREELGKNRKRNEQENVPSEAPTTAKPPADSLGAKIGKQTPKPTPPAAPESPVQSTDPRNVGFGRLAAQAKAKDITLAKSLSSKGLTPEQVEGMSEAEFNKHLLGTKFRPFKGEGLSRSFAAGRADIVKAMREIPKESGAVGAVGAIGAEAGSAVTPADESQFLSAIQSLEHPTAGQGDSVTFYRLTAKLGWPREKITAVAKALADQKKIGLMQHDSVSLHTPAESYITIEDVPAHFRSGNMDKPGKQDYVSVYRR